MAANKSDFANVWGMLDPEASKRIRTTDASLLGDAELVCRWDINDPGLFSMCMSALALFTDASNNAPQKWVKDPSIERQVYPGIYRLVTLDVDTQKQGLKGIIRTLRKGFAETAVWSEARIDGSQIALGNSVGAGVPDSASDSPDKELNIRFNNCSPFKLDAIAESLLSASYASGVTVGTEAYSGAWHCLSVGTKIEDDGSGTVSLRIARPTYTLQGYEDFGTERAQDVYYIADVPKDLAQGVLTAWKVAHPIGSSASCSYSRDQKLVNITLRVRAFVEKAYLAGIVKLDCRYSDELTIYMGVATPDLYPLPAVTDGMGISYDRLPTSNGDGTWDIRITKRTVKYRDVAGLTIEQNAEQSTVQRQQLGLTTQAMEPMLEVAGQVKTQRVEVKDDCSKDVTTNSDTGKAQTATERTVAKSYTEESTDRTYQAAQQALPTQETGKIKTVRNTPSKYPAMWNILERIRTLIHLPSAVVYDVADDDSAHAQATEDINVPNAAGVVVSLDAATGKSLSATVQYNKESDTLDVRKVEEVGKEMVSGSTEESAASKTVVSEKTFQSEQLEGETADGKIIRVENRKSKYADKYDTSRSEETGKAQQATTVVEAAGFTETTTEKTFQTAPLANPAQEIGHVKQVKNSPSKYQGRYDTLESDKEAKPLDSVSKGGGLLFDEETEVHKNAASDMSGGTSGAAGVVIDNASQKNDDGSYNNVTKKRTARPLGPVIDTHGTPLVEETVEKSVNQSSPPSPGTPAAGTSVDVQHDINESGKIDVSKTTRRGIAYSDGPRQTGADAFSTEQTTIKGNQAAISETFAPGTVKRVDVRVNDLKLLEAKIQETTPVADVDGPHVVHDDLYKRTVVTKYRNAVSPPLATTKGEDANSTKNDFGKYDGTLSKTTVTPFDIDIDEPTSYNEAKGFQRICYGLVASSEIQPKVQAFMAKASSQPNSRYRVTASVDRDGDGFYKLTLNANPKDSNGGGGSAEDWDAGIKFTLPTCWNNINHQRRYSSADITYTTSKVKAINALAAAPSIGESPIVVSSGAGGATGIQLLGRGRYKVTVSFEWGTW